MALKINPVPAETISETSEVEDDSTLLHIETSGKLQEEIEELKAKIAKSKAGARLKFASAELATLLGDLRTDVAAGVNEDVGVARDSDHFTYEMGKCSNGTEIVDKPALIKYLLDLGEEEFFALVNFKITDLRKYLPGKVFDAITKTERTGGRRVKLFRHSDDS